MGVWFAVFRTSGLETLLDENYVQRPLARSQEDTGPSETEKKEKQNATDVFGLRVWESENAGVLGQVVH